MTVKMGRTISVSLSSDGIKRLCNEMRSYERSLPEKTKKFMELLGEVGIKKAKEQLAQGTHHMPDYITLSKEVDIEGKNVTLLIVGEGETFVSQWTDRMGEENFDVVYPMHMMEFGSATYALAPSNNFGATVGGKGTFTKMGHQDEASWYINVGTVQEPEIKHGTAIKPTRPLYSAMEEMRSQIQQAAKEAFGGG